MLETKIMKHGSILLKSSELRQIELDIGMGASLTIRQFWSYLAHLIRQRTTAIVGAPGQAKFLSHHACITFHQARALTSSETQWNKLERVDGETIGRACCVVGVNPHWDIGDPSTFNQTKIVQSDRIEEWWSPDHCNGHDYCSWERWWKTSGLDLIKVEYPNVF